MNSRIISIILWLSRDILVEEVSLKLEEKKDLLYCNQNGVGASDVLTRHTNKPFPPFFSAPPQEANVIKKNHWMYIVHTRTILCRLYTYTIECFSYTYTQLIVHFSHIHKWMFIIIHICTIECTLYTYAPLNVHCTYSHHDCVHGKRWKSLWSTWFAFKRKATINCMLLR